GIALTIKLAQKPGGRTTARGNHMQDHMQAKFAVAQSAAPYRARHRKILQGTLAALIAIPLAGLQTRHVAAAEQAVVIPPPAVDAPVTTGGLQTVVLAGGCFWGVQAVYQHTKGVTRAVS